MCYFVSSEREKSERGKRGKKRERKEKGKEKKRGEGKRLTPEALNLGLSAVRSRAPEPKLNALPA